MIRDRVKKLEDRMAKMEMVVLAFRQLLIEKGIYNVVEDTSDTDPSDREIQSEG